MLLEKPLADNMQDARGLVDAIERARAGSLLVLTYRFHPARAVRASG